MDTVVIGDEALTVEDVVGVANGAGVGLTPQARERIRGSRALVDEILATGRPVYGVNTGVGHTKDDALPEDQLRAYQEMLLMTHAGGVGPKASTDLVRAAMLSRVAGMAAGGSGATEAAADTLVAMLNAGVHPIVPQEGSVGAGDLSQMAAIGQVTIGLGRAEYGGEIVPGGEALARAGIPPLVVEPKDGLALISANGLSIGRGALVLHRAERLAAAVDVVVALSMEATRGNASATEPAVGAAKPYPGQIEACRSIRAALEGSYLLQPDGPRSVQDALSFRVAPQVHGAFREVIAFARRALEIELNSRSDNPLVDAPSGSIVHNGNFHPMVLAVAFDALRVAVAHVGQLGDRRLSHLWDACFANMGPGGTPPADPAGQSGPPAEFFGLALRYAAAALTAELKQLAAPATLDIAPLDLGVEDHATGAPLSVRKTHASLGLLTEILAVELLLAGDVLSLTGAGPLGAGTGAALAGVGRVLPPPAPGRSPADVHRAVQEVVASLGPV